MRIRSFPFALLVSALVGLPIAAISSAQSQSNSAVAQLPDSHRSEQKALGTPAPESHRKIAAGYGKLPLSFEANAGQTDKRVKFLARGRGYGLFLTGQEAVFAFHGATTARHDSGSSKIFGDKVFPDKASRDKASRDKVSRDSILRMQLRGSNPTAQAEGVQPLPGMASYFVGKDPSQWHTNISTYSKVRFANVYPGIDLLYYGNQSQLEYDFIVAPKVNPKTIRLHFAGASKLALAENGDLSISAKDGQIAFHKPVIYQEVGGQRQPVEGRFTLLANNSVGFSLGGYDRSQPLIIDPVLAYSTYLGGSSGAASNAIAVDVSGNAYIAGEANPGGFPVNGVSFPYENSASAVITKLNADGSAVIYSTYLAGANLANAIAVDSAGNAYITGFTVDTNLPVTHGAIQTTNHDTTYGNAFVTKLNSTGSALLYSMYLGGSAYDLSAGDGRAPGDSGNGIAVDTQGNAYVAGITSSPDFPTTAGAFQAQNPGVINAFIAKLNPAGTELVYATYLGGPTSFGHLYPYGAGANSIALDKDGHVFIGGYSQAFPFPTTTGAFQTNRSDPIVGFIAELNVSGTGLVYSTLLGGTGGDGFVAYSEVRSIALDAAGNCYAVGYTNAPSFPVTSGVYQQTPPGGFVSKLNSTGSALLYSTFISAYAEPDSVAVDGLGDAYVAGNASSGLPTTPGAFEVADEPDVEDAFVTELNPAGSDLLYSTYLGGSSTLGSMAHQVAIDSAGNAYVTGTTSDFDFPVTTGAYQTTPYGVLTEFVSADAFVAKLNLSSPTPVTPTTMSLNETITLPSPGKFNITLTAQVTGDDNGVLPTGNVVFTLNYVYLATVPLIGNTATYSTIVSGEGADIAGAGYIGNADFGPSASALSYFNVLAVQPPVLSIPTASPYNPVPFGQYIGPVTVTITDSTPNAIIHYTLDGSNPTASSPTYSVPVTISSGLVALKANAIISGYLPSAVTEAIYSIVPQTPTPVISPGPGTYAAGQLITITDGTPGATIRYTLDGSTPTLKSTYYTGPIALTGSETIQAIALGAGEEPSNVASASFTVQ